MFADQFSKINLIVRFVNASDGDRQLFHQLVLRMQKKLETAKCASSGRASVRYWNASSENNEEHDALLFNEEDGLNVIIDIGQFSSKLFVYDILVQMPKINPFLERLMQKLDTSFLQRHQHPAEQPVRSTDLSRSTGAG